MKWLLIFLVGCADRPLSLGGGFGGSSAGTNGGTNGTNGSNGGGSNGSNGGGSNGGTGGTNGGTNGSNGGTNGTMAMPARLLSPLSTSTVTSKRPLLKWTPAVGEVELCADRACTTMLGTATVDSSGAAARPDADLPAGVVFWRVKNQGVSSATWELFVGQRSVGDGHFPGPLDVDGDGKPDSAVGVSGGGLAVYLGGATGLAQAPIFLASPDSAKANFGFVVAAAGDLDGDGFGDLAVGECGKGTTRVHVYYGSPQGSGLRASSQTLDSPDGQSGFGCRVAGAGDLDGDGYADLAVARVGDDFGGGLYIYRGGPNGLPSTSTRMDSPDQKPSRLGYSLAGVGDLDGDGFDDLAATEIDYSALTGVLHLYRGAAGGISNQAQITIGSNDPNGLQFGASVASAGDLDGDGLPDLVLGAPAVTTAAGYPELHVFYGGGTRLYSATAIIQSEQAPGFGFEVEGGADLDGDGYSDVVVMANGNLSLVFGGNTRVPTHIVAVDAAGQGANPRHAACAGDLDGDGFADFLVADGAGVELLLGGQGGLDRSRVLPVTVPSGGFSGAVL
jgi:hypothetical protein